MVNYKTVPVADVYKQDRLAGHLARDSDTVTFTYNPSYPLEDAQVANTLPVGRPVTATGGAVPAFFAGLLPEGLRLTALTAATKTSADDMLTLLLAVGGDTIGDVRVAPIGEPLPPADTVTATHAGESFTSMFAAAIGTTPDTVALPGVQEKMSGEMVSAHVSDRGIPAIVKLDPPGRDRMVANEHFFLQFAAACGIDVPEHDLRTDTNAQHALFVRRFDRIVIGTQMRRLAQEDVCQLANRYPSAKYQFTAQQAIRLIGDTVHVGGGSAPLAMLKALRIAAFSYLIGNGDLHAKNLSVHTTPTGGIDLTPAYDLLCTQPYLSWNDPQAMPLMGRDANLTADTFMSAAQHLGIGQRAIHTMLSTLRDTTPTWVNDLSAIGFDDITTSRLATLITQRANQLAPTSQPPTRSRRH